MKIRDNKALCRAGGFKHFARREQLEGSSYLKTVYALYTKLMEKKQARAKDQGLEQNLPFARRRTESVG